MSPELPDDDPRKWDYSEHARAKHAILETYLGAWLTILGRSRSKPPWLYIYEGFAGRGRYNGNEDGSPLLVYRAARAAVDRDVVQGIKIRCVEANRANYENLSGELASLGDNRVQIEAKRAKFADVVANLSTQLAHAPPGVSRPVFVTADPYGFSGVPLDALQTLMRHPRIEILVTFMVQSMRRFLTQEQHQVALTEFFGGADWRECLGSGEDRERCLLRRYCQRVKDLGVANHTLNFRVFEDERAQTLYYLIHLTNEPKGMREMKKAMIKTSGDMVFRPVTLAPRGQESFNLDEPAPYPSLQVHLLERFAARTLEFETVLNEDYPDGIWLEPQYRAAIKALARGNRGVAIRQKKTEGRRPSSLGLDDVVVFPALQPSLV